MPKTDNKLERAELTREQKVLAEVERQRNIYRIGTPDNVLQRAAIAALMERGEY